MTKKLSGIYKTFDVIVVPFPFADQAKVKNRPVVLLSSSAYFDQWSNHSIVAMITSASNSQWPLDYEIANLKSCGLLKPCCIRFKLFTLDHRLIKKKIGQLSRVDQKGLVQNFKLSFNTIAKKMS